MLIVDNVLAHRVGHVDSPQIPLARDVEIGITHLEIVMRDPGQTVDDVRRLLDPLGMQVASLHAPSPIEDDAVFTMIEDYARRATALGAKSLFVSVHTGDKPREWAYPRLRRLGDVAGEFGVALAMETHPNLCQNGDEMRQTMEAVDHPCVGVNFDCANVYYYNRDVTAAGEIAKVAKWVKSVHLKDTDGGFESEHFPVLGRGVVDFGAVFATLAEVGFHGPYTLELEGDAARAGSLEGLVENVRLCRQHLVDIGVL
jgi:sugar phosphate isomerase/epimerase